MCIGQVMEGEGDEEKGIFDPPLITSSLPGVETAPAPREARASESCFLQAIFVKRNMEKGSFVKQQKIAKSPQN